MLQEYANHLDGLKRKAGGQDETRENDPYLDGIVFETSSSLAKAYPGGKSPGGTPK